MIAFLQKELREHGFSPVLDVFAVLALLTMTTGLALVQDAPSLMPSVAQATALAAPLLALGWSHRLFIKEHADGTWRFLLGTPLPPGRIAAVKLALGHVLTLLPLLLGTLLVTELARAREIVGPDFLAAFVLELAATSANWFGVAALFSQLGRYRVGAWAILLAVLGTGQQIAPELVANSGLGRALFLDPGAQGEIFERAQGVSLVWAVAGTLGAAWLLTRHGGTEVVERQRPADGWERGLVAVAVAGAFLVSDGVLALHRAFAGTSSARSADALGAIEGELEKTLRAAGVAVPVSLSWNTDVEDPRLLAADGGAMLRRLARATLWESAARDPAKDRLRAGLASVLTGAGAPGGIPRGLSPEDLRAWTGVLDRHGLDVAEAVSAVGLGLALSRCGEQRLDLLAALESGRRSGFGQAWEAWTGRDPLEACGLDPRGFEVAWAEALELAANMDPLPEVELARAGTSGSPTCLEIRPSTALPASAELWWAELDPLAELDPMALNPRRAEIREPCVVLPASPRARLAATIAVPGGESYLISGWKVVGPR